eukprot:403374990
MSEIEDDKSEHSDGDDDEHENSVSAVTHSIQDIGGDDDEKQNQSHEQESDSIEQLKDQDMQSDSNQKRISKNKQQLNNSNNSKMDKQNNGTSNKELTNQSHSQDDQSDNNSHSDQNDDSKSEEDEDNSQDDEQNNDDNSQVSDDDHEEDDDEESNQEDSNNSNDDQQNQSQSHKESQQDSDPDLSQQNGASSDSEQEEISKNDNDTNNDEEDSNNSDDEDASVIQHSKTSSHQLSQESSKTPSDTQQAADDIKKAKLRDKRISQGLIVEDILVDKNIHSANEEISSSKNVNQVNNPAMYMKTNTVDIDRQIAKAQKDSINTSSRQSYIDEESSNQKSSKSSDQEDKEDESDQDDNEEDSEEDDEKSDSSSKDNNSKTENSDEEITSHNKSNVKKTISKQSHSASNSSSDKDNEEEDEFNSSHGSQQESKIDSVQEQSHQTKNSVNHAVMNDSNGSHSQSDEDENDDKKENSQSSSNSSKSSDDDQDIKGKQNQQVSQSSQSQNSDQQEESDQEDKQESDYQENQQQVFLGKDIQDSVESDNDEENQQDQLENQQDISITKVQEFGLPTQRDGQNSHRDVSQRSKNKKSSTSSQSSSSSSRDQNQDKLKHDSKYAQKQKQKQIKQEEEFQSYQKKSNNSISQTRLPPIHQKKQQTNNKFTRDQSGVNFNAQDFNISEEDDLRKETPMIYKDFQKEDPNCQNIYFGSQERKDQIQVVTNKFKRVSNIYFLMISILTFLPFSPKDPTSMIGTFAFVLIFTMLKEAYEDFQRYKQDQEINSQACLVLNQESMHFEQKKWEDISPGQIIKIQKEDLIPADTLLLYSSSSSGIAYVDTLNLDGETNLKDKTALLENYEDRRMVLINGMIKCENPNENLEKWEGLIMFENSGLKPLQTDIKNLALRGCLLRNTQFAIGVVVYTGMNTKIMKNHKKPRFKMSNIMILMNKMLYTVFAFQFVIVILMAGLNVQWDKNNSSDHQYLSIDKSNKAATFFIQLLVYWTTFSHMIPISLYVIIELLKLGISMFLNNDVLMYDTDSKTYSKCKNSDLVEELGQIELVFSDKTGTLTQNKMIFRKCQINGIRFGEILKGEHFIHDGMCLSGIKQVIKEAKNELDQENVDSEDEEQYPYVTQFFLNLALCNTVQIEKIKESKEISYKATSPDELALVVGAKSSGVQLIDRQKDSVVIYNMIKKIKEQYQVKAVFPFDQERKRQSVLIKTQDKNYILYTKGADSVMMDRIKFEKNFVDGIQEIVDEDLRHYATQGFRTLVMCNRVILKQEYQQFKKIYANIMRAKPGQREEKLDMLYDVMEQKLRYLGSSALEDKLQEGVPLTIEQLLKTDIRFFMLTGDKLETAREIGRSCKLVQSDMQEIILANMNQRQLENAFEKLLNYMKVDIDYPITSLEEAPQFQQVVIVEGPILAMIFSDGRLNDLFFHLCIRSKSVICCRMSPKQKADIVNMFRSRGKWITLAIGDGANDVSMLNEAHIGVGITGQEGNQAARAADFSISQFQFLMRLVLFHGRMSYLRVSKMICYYFYKNIILVFTELYFPFYNGFSGQIFFLDWLPMMYNAIFTSWYCLFSQLLERDVNDQYSYRYPIVYKAGQLGRYFNYRIFWKWIILALIHGALCFFIPIMTSTTPNSDKTQGTIIEHWVRSTISFSVIIHVVFYKNLIETRHFNAHSFLFGILSLALYYGFLGVGQIPIISYLTQNEGLGVFIEMLEDPSFWLQVVILPFGCLIPDLSLFFMQQVFYATPVDTIISKQNFDPHFDFRIYQKTKQIKEDVKSRVNIIASTEQRKEIIKARRQTYLANRSPLAMPNFKQNLLNEQDDIFFPGDSSNKSGVESPSKKLLTVIHDHDTDDESDSQSNSSGSSNSGSHNSKDHNNEHIQSLMESEGDNLGRIGGIQPSKKNKIHPKLSGDTKRSNSDTKSHSRNRRPSDENQSNDQDHSGTINSDIEESKSQENDSDIENQMHNKKARDLLNESSRSLNMSLRSNQGLVGQAQISRKHKKQRRAHNQSSNSEYSSSQNQHNSNTSQSYVSAVVIQGKKNRNKVRQGFVDSNQFQEDQSYQEMNTYRRNRTSNMDQVPKNHKKQKLQKDQFDQSLHDSSLNSSYNDKNKLLRNTENSSKAVTAKAKVPRLDFTRKIFGNLFRNNQSKLLNATQSAFDFKKFRKDESKNPASFVMDQLVNAILSERMRAPDDQNKKSATPSAHPEFVQTLGHPLETGRRAQQNNGNDVGGMTFTNMNDFHPSVKKQHDSPRKKQKKYLEKYRSSNQQQQ